MESEKRLIFPQTALNSHSSRSNPLSMRPTPRDRSCSPQRTVRYDSNRNTSEVGPVHQSLSNPHYRPVQYPKPQTNFEIRCHAHEFDRDISNWSLAPSGRPNSPPPPPPHPSPGANTGACTTDTASLTVPRRIVTNALDDGRMKCQLNKTPPRPPMPKRTGRFDADRLLVGGITHQRLEMHHFREAVQSERQNGNCEVQKSSQNGVKEEKETTEPPSTSTAYSLSPFDPRRADDSATTELESVWERTRVRKTRTVQEAISLENAQELNFTNKSLTRDYDSPITTTEQSKGRDPTELNGQTESRKATVKTESRNKHTFEKFQNLTKENEVLHQKFEARASVSHGADTVSFSAVTLRL